MEFLKRDDAFLHAFLDKGRVSPLLDLVPLYVVKGDDMGQRGAHLRAVQLLRQGPDPGADTEARLQHGALVPPRSLNTIVYVDSQHTHGDFGQLT